MKFSQTPAVIALFIISLLIAACGGSGGGGSVSGGSDGGGDGDLVPSANFVMLQSAIGDYIGAGQKYEYTQADAQISLNPSGGLLTVTITGDESWSGDFKVPESMSQLEPGFYGELQRYPFHNPVEGGLSWSGEGRCCNTLTGWFEIESVTYENGFLTAVDLNFEQHCEDAVPALYGQIHWRADDPTEPPGPVDPPPAGLWQPEPGSTPASGNYVYLESEPGDYIGIGLTYTYTPADAQISVNPSEGLINVGITGDERWSGSFKAMTGLSQLEPGYYGDLQRYPFHNPVKGGLSWSGEGRGCNTLTGWFAVDNVSYENGVMTAVDLRFEQHCEGGPPALYGQIHWRADDPAEPPGPVDPPPAGSWQPEPGSTPASGNYVYLESEPGDYIGAGLTYTYIPADALISLNPSGGLLNVGISGDESWTGNFQVPESLSQLEPGYYGDLQRYPFHNPVKGGLSWSGEGRGCNTLTGWFAVDSVTYENGVLTAVDLRFEQHCEGGPPALYGQIHWQAGDPAEPPGPVDPPPAGLWEPEPGSTPVSGNYVYLESEPGDYIGAGLTYTYTPADALISLNPSVGLLNVSIAGDESWTGSFKAMTGLSQLEPGYYGDLQRYPFHNPVKGGLSWSGEHRGCNTLTGWFAVDSVTYENGVLTAVDLRFEQHCEGGPPALYGQIHWVH